MNQQWKLGLVWMAAALVIAPTILMARSVPENSKVRFTLSHGSGDDDAIGTVDFRSTRGTSRMKLQIKNGPGSSELRLLVGGVERATFTTSPNGSATVQFQNGAASGKSRSLDFDPRGELIEIEDDSDDSICGNDDGGGNPTNVVASERANLTSTGIQPGASGHAELKSKAGRQDFEVEIEDVADGSYDLLVDGIARGTIQVVAGVGQIEFSTGDPGKLPLTFDPFGKLIQVSQNSAIILTGTLLASAPGVNVCAPSETTTALTNVGPDPDASGDARLRTRDDCRRDFRVEVEDLPVGSYDLYVGGVLRGAINVAVQLDMSVQGEIEFSTDPDDSDELPLDFDPAGQSIEVKQASTAFLSTTLGTPSGGSCDVVDVEPSFTNTGADGDAKGKARFRQETDCDRDFRVEIEDLPLGDYELLVGGVVRGSITVRLVASEAVGEIEFDTDPDEPGEVLLTFDPRGQLVEVRPGATTFLTVTMPN